MHNKDVFSPSSKDGSNVGVNTAGFLQTNAGAPSSSALNNESLPSLVGNCSNNGGSLDQDSVSGTDYDMRVTQKHPENSDDEIEALQQENGQFRIVNNNLHKFGHSNTKSNKMDVCSLSSKAGFGTGVNTAGSMQSNAGAFSSSYSALTNESLPSLTRNCSNAVSDSLYSDTVSGTEYDLPVIQKLPEKSDEAEASVKELQKNQIEQFPNVNKELSQIEQLSKSVTYRHEETSKEVEAQQQEKGQLHTVNKELQKNLQLSSKSITSAIEVNNKDVSSPGVNISGKNAALLKLPPRKMSKGQSLKQLGPKTPRKLWTPVENDAFAKAISEKENITPTQLQKIPELKDRPRESLKTKLREHKLVSQPEAILRGEIWTTGEDEQLMAAYKIHGKNYQKLMESCPGRTLSGVYNRIHKYDKQAKENKVDEQGGSKEVGSRSEMVSKAAEETELPQPQPPQEGSKTVEESELPQEKENAELMKNYIGTVLKEMEKNITQKMEKMEKKIIEKIEKIEKHIT